MQSPSIGENSESQETTLSFGSGCQTVQQSNLQQQQQQQLSSQHLLEVLGHSDDITVEDITQSNESASLLTTNSTNNTSASSPSVSVSSNVSSSSMSNNSSTSSNTLSLSSSSTINLPSDDCNDQIKSTNVEAMPTILVVQNSHSQSKHILLSSSNIATLTALKNKPEAFDTNKKIDNKLKSISTGEDSGMRINDSVVFTNDSYNNIINKTSGNTTIKINTSNSSVTAANLNVLVTQQSIRHPFVKTFTIGTATKNGIFVPNVISTNSVNPSQFNVHHPFGFHGNANGPAPNVTVNPNGAFNTNSSAALRPGLVHPVRTFLHQNANINFNVITNQITGSVNSSNATTHSPLLAAQLQTINKIASNQAQKFNLQSSFTSSGGQQPFVSNFVQSSTPSEHNSNDKTTENNQTQKLKNEDEIDSSGSSSDVNANDQTIRVLTPSEIMRTLPSLPNQDLGYNFDIPIPSIDIKQVSSPVTTTTTTITLENSNPSVECLSGTQNATIVASQEHQTVRDDTTKSLILWFHILFYIS